MIKFRQKYFQDKNNKENNYGALNKGVAFGTVAGLAGVGGLHYYMDRGRKKAHKEISENLEKNGIKVRAFEIPTETIRVDKKDFQLADKIVKEAHDKHLTKIDKWIGDSRVKGKVLGGAIVGAGAGIGHAIYKMTRKKNND